MRTRSIVLALAFCLTGAVASFASDPNVGTWKLNEAKSKIPAGANKITSIVYTAADDKFHGVVEGTDGSGNPMHNEWTGKFDGKEYPVTGDPNTDARAIQKVDNRHYKTTNKKGGKPTLTGTIVFSADGKTRTLTTQSKDASGKETTATYVFEKQ